MLSRVATRHLSRFLCRQSFGQRPASCTKNQSLHKHSANFSVGGGGAWIPPDSHSDRTATRGEKPAGVPSAPSTHRHPHKTVVKVGDNEWQASIMVDGDFHELGIFRSKAEAAAEVRDWMDLLKDPEALSNAAGGILASWGGLDSRHAENVVDAEKSATSWVRPDDASRFAFDNPILDMDSRPQDSPRELTVTEIVNSLEHDNAEDISVLDMSTHRGGAGSLGDYCVFATGKSTAHLRKMGDVIVKALQMRGQWELEPLVEGRDSDDGWMIVDCGRVIVHLFEEEAREGFGVEELWLNNGCEKVVDLAEHEKLGVIADRD